MRTPGNKSILYLAIAAALVAVWFGGAVMAQREGPKPPAMPQIPGPPIMLKAGSAGVFVLTGNVLTKYDAALSMKGSIKLDVDSGDTANVQQPAPPPPTHMLLSPGPNQKVLVLIGDRFFSVNAETFEIAAKAQLPPPPKPEPPARDNPPTENGGDRPDVGPRPPIAPPGPPMPAGLELQGNVLYMLRGPEIIGVNINDGSIVGPAPLPKLPAPEQGA